jgi:hypothetical protein
MFEGIGLIAKEGFSYAFFEIGFELIDISDGSLGVYKLIYQRPKTSSWVFIRPAL